MAMGFSFSKPHTPVSLIFAPFLWSTGKTFLFRRFFLSLVCGCRFLVMLDFPINLFSCVIYFPGISYCFCWHFPYFFSVLKMKYLLILFHFEGKVKFVDFISHLDQKSHKFPILLSLIYFEITYFYNFCHLYCHQANNILLQEDLKRIITWIYISNPLSFLHCFILVV